MSFNLTEAKRSKAKLRLAIDGPSGSGKTYSALLIAYGLCGDWSKIAVVDTERESANLYADLCTDGQKYLTGQINVPFTPQKYLEALKACEAAGMEVVIIDSLTHAWTAEGGMLDLHDAAVRAQKTANSYTAWADVTPLHRKLVDAILTSPVHVISTIRSDTEYTQEKDPNTGRTVVKKVGMKPQFRKGLDYEMTLVFSLEQSHKATITKSRINTFPVNEIILPTVETGKKLLEWLNTGDAPKCADCGNDVEGYGNMTAEQVAATTARKYGRTLCVNCGAKAKELKYDETSSKEPIPDPLAKEGADR